MCSGWPTGYGKHFKQQPSMLPGPAVPGCCLVSFRFLLAILCPQAVVLVCSCMRRRGVAVSKLLLWKSRRNEGVTLRIKFRWLILCRLARDRDQFTVAGEGHNCHTCYCRHCGGGDLRQLWQASDKETHEKQTNFRPTIFKTACQNNRKTLHCRRYVLVF